MRNSHTKLNVDEYIHLKIAVVDNGNANNLGKLIILISTTRITGTVALSENNFNS